MLGPRIGTLYQVPGIKYEYVHVAVCYLLLQSGAGRSFSVTVVRRESTRDEDLKSSRDKNARTVVGRGGEEPAM